MMELIDIRTLDLIDLDLVKGGAGGFKHGYYSHLVPKKIMTTDGVERIYWVAPDPGKRPKLKLVSHHKEGAEAEHHAEITQTHDIKTDDLKRFSAGDKVLIGRGDHKGKTGIFRGSVASDKNMTPRVSVAVHNSTKGKMESVTLNVNDISVTERATPETLNLIERSTVEATNLKGETILVDKADYEKYYKDRPAPAPEEIPKVIYDKASMDITLGGVYVRNADGKKFKVISATDDQVMVQVVDPGKDDPTAWVRKEQLQKLLTDKGYYRAALPSFRAETRVAKPRLDADGKPVMDSSLGKPFVDLVTEKTDRPVSHDLESGKFHREGLIVFDDRGHPKFSGAGEEMAKAVLSENWTRLDQLITVEVNKFPSVDSSEMGVIVFYDQLLASIAQYDPYRGGVAKGILGRLGRLARALTKNKALILHEKHKITSAIPEEGLSADSVVAVTDDEPAGKELDLGGGGFVDMRDAIMLEQGIEDEADFVRWHYEDPSVADTISEWLGFGRRSSTLTRKEAAEKLVGHVPYSLATIETEYLPDERMRLVDAMKTEAEKYPEFKHLVLNNLRLREKLNKKRKIIASDEKDFPTAVAEKLISTHDGGKKARAVMAAGLIKHGIDLHDVPKTIQLVEMMVGGQVMPFGYPEHIPSKHVGPLDSYFKELFKGDEVPARFRIKDIFREHYAKSDDRKSAEARTRVMAELEAEEKVLAGVKPKKASLDD